MQNLGLDAYYKPSLGLYMLRNYILDSTRFDYAFRTYINRWAYKHPSPNDFFRTINDAAGENLNWFWKEWFFEDWTLDQAVKDVKYIDNDPQKELYYNRKPWENGYARYSRNKGKKQ